MVNVEPDLEIAGAFLKRLDPTEKHTFQIIHDSKKNQKARILHGTIWDHAEEFLALQKDGYGVFVCINKTDGKGRETKNITAIRALAADLDGAPKENIYRFGLVPSVTVESSPGKYHAWWFMDEGEVSLDKYTPLMERLAAIIESDHKICDLPRVLRVPGFFHQKGEAFQSRIIDETPRTYTLADIEDELASIEGAKVKEVKSLGKSALDDACKKIRGAKEGERNDTMFKQAARIARSVKKGLLNYDIALGALVEAASAHKDGREIISDQFRRTYEKLPDEKPLKEVILVEGQEGNVALEITRHLVETGRVFQRARSLVTPLVDERKWGSTNSFLAPLTHETIVHLLKDTVVFSKHDGRGNKTKVSKLTHELSDQILKLGYWPSVPRCEGIINTPTVRFNGSILSKPGYDELTKYYLDIDRSLNMPAIPDAPTKEDAIQAKNLFFSLLDEVAFCDDLDKAVALSAALTTVSRAAYDRAPMFLISANASGTGKSYLVYLITTLACGAPAPVIGYSASADELEKRLDGLILDAVPCFSLDNVEETLNGPPKLCQIMSEDSVGVRKLGQSSTFFCSPHATVFATGNGVNFGSDMIRRGLTARLNSKTERPETREFKHDPAEEVTRNRGKYVAALLTIIRAYLSTGVRVKVEQFASYNHWSKFCREPVLWLGMEDPINCQIEARASDDRENDRKAVVEWLVKRYPNSIKFKSSEFLKDVRDAAEDEGKGAVYNISRDDALDMLEYLNSVCGTRKGDISRVRLGMFLNSLVGRIVGDKWLQRDKTTTNGNYYKVDNVRAHTNDH